jgi:Domain of unknown function (DUF4411)
MGTERSWLLGRVRGCRAWESLGKVSREEGRGTFAELLRQHRLAAGLTQEALADRAGLKWTQQGNKNHADPFVIAVAEIRSCMVISGETNGGPGKPKIPYVCSQRQVKHGKFIDMVVVEGWVFG